MSGAGFIIQLPCEPSPSNPGEAPHASRMFSMRTAPSSSPIRSSSAAFFAEGVGGQPGPLHHQPRADGLQRELVPLQHSQIASSSQLCSGDTLGGQQPRDFSSWGALRSRSHQPCAETIHWPQDEVRGNISSHKLRVLHPKSSPALPQHVLWVIAAQREACPACVVWLQVGWIQLGNFSSWVLLGL